MTSDVSINDLPDELLEFIFGYMPPYKDLESCALVCKRWTNIVRNVRRHTTLNFNKGLMEFRLRWKALNNIEITPIIAGRYSHSAIVYKNSMFVFGGGSSTSTTFNDLWRFDLSNRKWDRPISMGNYPSPKANATLVCYKNSLILFGGYRHPTTFPPYQTWRLFDELHSYNVTENRWISINASDGQTPPAVTGHSASIHNDAMIVFGGFSQDEHNGTSKNDLWSFDFTTLTWTRKETCQLKPAPRYGQFQIALSDNHCLIMGGCGGPNNLYNDAWLLDMSQEPWQWKQINIRNKKWAASHMWCNPACKVGSKLIVLGPVASALTDFQMIRHQVLPSNRNNAHLRVNANNQGLPPNQPNQNNLRSPYIRNQYGEPSNYHRRDDGSGGGGGGGARQRINGDNNAIRQNVNQNVNVNANVNGVGNGDEQPRQMHANNADDVQNRLQHNLNLHLRSRRHDTDMLANMPKRFNESPALSHDRIAMAAFNDDNVDGPSTSKVVSPRERRLQSLRRMEEKMQAMRKVNSPINEPLSIDDQSAPQKRIKRNCIGLFVCDISNILLTENPYIEWIEHKNFGCIENAPERLILSSLCTGNGELIMFGGLRKESLNRSPETVMQVSNAMHFLQVPKEII